MSYRKRRKSRWSKEVLKTLIDRDMQVSDLADELGIDRTYCSAIVHGRSIVPDVADRISGKLDITVPYDE